MKHLTNTSRNFESSSSSSATSIFSSDNKRTKLTVPNVCNNPPTTEELKTKLEGLRVGNEEEDDWETMFGDSHDDE